LGSICGNGSTHLLNQTASGSGKDDKRVSSVGAAVEFAKANNLLGLFVDSELLVCSSVYLACVFGANTSKKVKVPSLIDGIRSAELIVGVYGTSQTLMSLRAGSTVDNDGSIADAFVADGVVNFLDRSMRELA